MENPSSSILKDFKIKIAVDTQLLAYLIDNTYPSFNFFLKNLLNHLLLILFVQDL
jgi:hypothetical protein